MAKIFIFALVVVLELGAAFGFFISNKAVNNDTDVYEVTEEKPTNTLKFLNPKREKPTLREIIYLHVIETPYEQVIKEPSTINKHNSITFGHDKVDNDNSITDNSHDKIENINKIKTLAEDDHSKSIDDKNKIDVNRNVINVESVINNDDDKRKGIDFVDSRRPWTNGHGYQYFKPEDQSGPVDVDSTVDDNNVDSEQDQLSPIEDSTEDNTIDDDILVTDSDAADEEGIPPEDDNIPHENENDRDMEPDQPATPLEANGLQKTAIDIDSIQNIGWMDFIQDDDENQRKKRSIDTAIGPPPTLPPLDVDALPDFIKAILNKPNSNELNPSLRTIADDDELDTNRNESEDFEEPASNEDSSFEESIDEPKTYGMRLTGDSGVVWNNLNNRESSYPIGIGLYNNNIEEHVPALRKSRDNDDDDVIDDEIQSSENEIEDTDSGEELDVEEPIKPAKTYGMNLTGDHGVVWNDLNGHRVTYRVGDDNGNTEDNTTENVSETTTESTLDKTSDEAKPTEDEEEKQSPDLSMELDDASKANPRNNTEILKVIIDTIKDIFKNETAKLENRLNCSNDSKVENGDNSKDSENNTKEDDSVTTEGPVSTEAPIVSGGSDDDDGKTKPQLPDISEDLMKNDEFWKWLNNWTSTYLDLLLDRIDNHIKEEVAKQIAEYLGTSEEDKTKPDENDIDIDGNESTKNATDSLKESIAKKRKDKECEDKKEPINIDANTVYGNSVGNDKVTNVFIFNLNNKTDLDKFKPLLNGTNGIYIFGNDDKNADEDKQIDKGSEENEKPDTTTNNGFENDSDDKNSKEKDEDVAIDQRFGSEESIDNNDQTNDDKTIPEEIDEKNEGNENSDSAEEKTSAEEGSITEGDTDEGSVEDNKNIGDSSEGSEDKVDKSSTEEVDKGENDTEKESAENSESIVKDSREEIDEDIEDAEKETKEESDEHTEDDETIAETDESNKSREEEE